MTRVRLAGCSYGRERNNFSICTLHHLKEGGDKLKANKKDYKGHVVLLFTRILRNIDENEDGLEKFRLQAGAAAAMNGYSGGSVRI